MDVIPNSGETRRGITRVEIGAEQDAEPLPDIGLSSLQYPAEVVDLAMFLPALMGPGLDYDRIAQQTLASLETVKSLQAAS